MANHGYGYTIGYTNPPWPEGDVMDDRTIRRRPTHVGVINQELWSAHGRRRAIAGSARRKGTL